MIVVSCLQRCRIHDLVHVICYREVLKRLFLIIVHVIIKTFMFSLVTTNIKASCTFTHLTPLIQALSGCVELSLGIFTHKIFYGLYHL